MSFPTVLGPWFVVQRFHTGPSTYEDEVLLGMEYYATAEEVDVMFSSNPKHALLFMSLASAARVAASEGGHVRVLTTKEEAEEFGRS